MMSMKQLEQAAKEIALWIEWERQMINDFHAYAHRFGGTPGKNVYEFVLRDALRLQGLTLEQFRQQTAAKEAGR